jgi:hypothetical protein
MKTLEAKVVTLYGGFPPAPVIVARVLEGAKLVAQASGCFANEGEAHDWASGVIVALRERAPCAA